MRYMDRTVYFDRKGYPIVWINGRNCKIHILEWERLNGPKPKGHDIHHRDGNKGNWAISNLELLTKQDHQRLHAGWIKEGGLWVAKPCTACRAILPLEAFYPRKGYTPTALCKPCHCAATEKWANKNPAKRKLIASRWYHNHKERYGKQSQQ